MKKSIRIYLQGKNNLNAWIIKFNKNFIQDSIKKIYIPISKRN